MMLAPATTRLVRYHSVSAFREAAWPFLLQHEAGNCIILGTVSGMTDVADDHLLATVVQDEQVVAVAMRTPPFGVILSGSGAAAVVGALVDEVVTSYDAIPSALGHPDVAQPFVQACCQRTGASSHISMTQGIYQLETVIMPQTMTGHGFIAGRDDMEQVVAYYRGFRHDVGVESRSDDELRTTVAKRIDATGHNGYYLWQHDDDIVSMAGYMGPTGNGIRIGAVYTPPALRGRGYASACVASLSQHLLDSGYRFCFLYTDMNNPVSNHIYIRMGYRYITPSVEISFESQRQ